MSRVFVIAEAGVNHNGDRQLAEQLIDVATSAGADAVKFQTFRAADLVTRQAPKADYQIGTTGADESQFEMIRRLELDEQDHAALMAHARASGIAFLSTPFDLASVRLLTGRFGLDTLKVPSGELTNAPLLLEVARSAKRIICSTGMSTLEEVEHALGVFAFGFTAAADARPDSGAFARAFASADGRAAVRARVTLLHCTTEYPAPPDEVNLRAMDTLAAAFGVPVGYSDHTTGIHVALAAVARGATVIEKHFTIDRSLPGPDHRASLEPGELRALVDQTREIERALGDGVKAPTPSELKNRAVARKSLVALRELRAGERFTEDNLGCKRPGGGVTPFRYWELLGTPAARSYTIDEPIDA